MASGDPFAGSPAPQAFFFGSCGGHSSMDQWMDAAGAPTSLVGKQLQQWNMDPVQKCVSSRKMWHSDCHLRLISIGFDVNFFYLKDPTKNGCNICSPMLQPWPGRRAKLCGT